MLNRKIGLEFLQEIGNGFRNALDHCPLRASLKIRSQHMELILSADRKNLNAAVIQVFHIAGHA